MSVTQEVATALARRQADAVELSWNSRRVTLPHRQLLDPHLRAYVPGLPGSPANALAAVASAAPPPKIVSTNRTAAMALGVRFGRFACICSSGCRVRRGRLVSGWLLGPGLVPVDVHPKLDGESWRTAERTLTHLERTAAGRDPWRWPWVYGGRRSVAERSGDRIGLVSCS